MKKTEVENADGVNWNLTTFAGARQEQLRRWSQLSLRDILLAQEEMQDLANLFHAHGPKPLSSAIAAEIGDESAQS